VIRNPPKAFHTRGAANFEGHHSLQALTATSDTAQAGENTRIRYNTYSHVLPGMQEKAVNAITDLLTGEVNKQ
jgi:hypothetical protein